MIYLILIFSFLLDGILFSLFSFTNPVAPLFSLLSLLIIYPYCDTNKKNYYIYPIVLGMFYDITYSNSLFLNTLIFTGFSYILIRVFKLFTINFINVLVIGTISIIAYRVIVFAFMHFIGVIPFNVDTLIESISYSFISNYIYIIVLYFAEIFIASKLKAKKYN